jgi:hypothetical protein
VGNCSLIYHKLRILNPNGSILASFNGVCAGHLVGPVTLPTSGTYTVAAYAYAPYSGTVTVHVHDVVDETGTLTFGQAANASLRTPGQRALWTFSGIQGRRISAVIDASTLSFCQHFNTFGIWKPDGTVLGALGNVCGGTILGPFVLPATGTYTLIVDPSSSYTGQVAVTVHEFADVSGSVVLNGPPVSAVLATPGQRGFWTFSGTAGQKLRAAMNTSTVSQCSVYNSFGILKPDGSALGTQWNMCAGAVTAQLTLPTDGVYTLLVDPAGSSTGSVTARVIDPVVLVNGTAPPTGIKVAPSTIVSVQVTGAPGNAKDMVTLAAVGTGNNSYLALQYVPTSGAALSFKMPATPGTYEFRLIVAGSVTRIATSSAVSVQ